MNPTQSQKPFRAIIIPSILNNISIILIKIKFPFRWNTREFVTAEDVTVPADAGEGAVLVEFAAVVAFVVDGAAG